MSVSVHRCQRAQVSVSMCTGEPAVSRVRVRGQSLRSTGILRGVVNVLHLDCAGGYRT